MAARPEVQAVGSSLATRENVLPAAVETAAAAVAAQAKAAVEARYLVALSRPRDMELVRKKVLAACDRPGFAEAALYRKPVGQSFVTGPSIRMAEEVARAMGNLLNDSVVVFDDDDRRIMRVSVTDLESNLTYPYDAVVEKTIERSSVRSGQEVISSRMNTQNKKVYRIRASDDDITIKQNAHISKAMRTGVFRVFPSDLLEEAIQRVQATLKKLAKEGVAIEAMLGAFLKIEVTEEMIQSYLRHSVEDITPEEFSNLRGIYQAIKDGETTWEQVTAHVPEKPQAQRGVRTEGYGEPKKVETETIHLADQKKPTGPPPPDPYLEQPPPPEPQG